MIFDSSCSSISTMLSGERYTQCTPISQFITEVEIFEYSIKLYILHGNLLNIKPSKNVAAVN